LRFKEQLQAGRTGEVNEEPGDFGLANLSETIFFFHINAEGLEFTTGNLVEILSKLS